MAKSNYRKCSACHPVPFRVRSCYRRSFTALRIATEDARACPRFPPVLSRSDATRLSVAYPPSPAVPAPGPVAPGAGIDLRRKTTCPVRGDPPPQISAAAVSCGVIPPDSSRCVPSRNRRSRVSSGISVSSRRSTASGLSGGRRGAICNGMNQAGGIPVAAIARFGCLALPDIDDERPPTTQAQAKALEAEIIGLTRQEGEQTFGAAAKANDCLKRREPIPG